VLGDPALRGTVLFVRAQGRAVTADEVAAQLGVPRSAARWRLERLAEAGLLITGFERRSGRRGPGGGRPAKTYAAAAETEAIEFPRRRYELLIGLLIGSVPQRRRGKELAQVGYEFGAELARAARVRSAPTARAGLERVCRALGSLGFQATVESASDEEAVIVSATCPLRPLVQADPEARAIDEGMWRGLFAVAAGRSSASRVVCRTHDSLDGDHPCRIVVELAG
jgi:predicted ArsR family transcriptional regulator